MIKKYIKKPVIIEALQWTGYNEAELKSFVGDALIMRLESDAGYKAGVCPPAFTPIIHTLEGNMTASKNDYIIKGVHGEFYPCKPDIFLETYDMVEN